MNSNNVIRTNERGNVLFLILIAVALFAALSYAVTQSTRSSGGDTSKETATLDVAQILTVPNTYRTAVQRMMLTQELDGGGIIATPPLYFSSATAAQNTHNIYHPTGGAMPYPLPPATMMHPDYATNEWVFNSENEVKNIGTTTTIPEQSSVDLIVMLPGLKKAVCEAINHKLGITGAMPVSIAVDTSMIASSDPPTYMENGGSGVIGSNTSDENLSGKAEGCFRVDGMANFYVFYAVVLPR